MYDFYSQAQNEVREKLEELSAYQADRHFRFLSKNDPRIAEATLYSLIPFKNESGEFRPFDFLSDAIGGLNKKGSDCCSAEKHLRAGLTFDGFLNLISVKRATKTGKELRVTMAHRLSFNELVSQRLNVFAEENDIFRKADHIVGLLIFIECLKQSAKYGPPNMSEREESQISTLLQSRVRSEQKLNNNFVNTADSSLRPGNRRSQLGLSRLQKQSRVFRDNDTRGSTQHSQNAQNVQSVQRVPFDRDTEFLSNFCSRGAAWQPTWNEGPQRNTYNLANSKLSTSNLQNSYFDRSAVSKRSVLQIPRSGRLY